MIDEEQILEDNQELAVQNHDFVNPIDPDEHLDEDLTFGFNEDLKQRYLGLFRTHKQIVRAKFQGAKSYREIAKVTKSSLSSVQNSLKNPIVQEVISEMLKIKKQEIKNEMLYQLSEAGRDAILTLRNLMVNAESESIKYKAAQAVLDIVFKNLNGTQVTIKDNNILVSDKLP